MNKLAKIFSAVLDIPEGDITDALSPENASNWDSLNAIILLTEIEKQFNVQFTYDEAMGIKNFGEAVALVRSKGGAV
jgi:acyl carrier protein